MSSVKAGAVPGEQHHHAHHFESADHEFVTAKQGMWLFLLQEILFFSPLFVGFFIYRGLHLQDFHTASHLLDWKLGGLNTLILICSSFTMARAVSAAQTGRQERLVRNLIATFVFACGFLIVKYFEYSHKIHVGTLPAGLFTATELGSSAPAAPLFFSFYFMMTGLHGIHVLGGMVYLAFVIRRAMRREFGPSYYTPVEMFGLYWHFVDLVWIYLFPLLYLVG